RMRCADVHVALHERLRFLSVSTRTKEDAIGMLVDRGIATAALTSSGGPIAEESVRFQGGLTLNC
ncbi:MAG TPA: hypothetical protein VEX68_27805, partial [Bryobacteraceae bacterium]|nr:hypothetical protein [Bryobacteraceae bacterium]